MRVNATQYAIPHGHGNARNKKHRLAKIEKYRYHISMSDNKTIDALENIRLSGELARIVQTAEIIIPRDREHLLDLTIEKNVDFRNVEFAVPGKGRVIEATVTRCKNGVVINYLETYMRRRDPEAMVIGDDMPTDKPRYAKRFGEPFTKLRGETHEWLASQERLVVMPFLSGDKQRGYPSLCIAPLQAAFLVAALADLQGFIPLDEIPKDFTPCAVLFVAPPFRHTHFAGKQVVVHNRTEGMHELYSYNLYPGPAAKKGIYGVLLNRGEIEGWSTLHCATVRLITPYDNEFVILHEGASGSGKSEMAQNIHRDFDGRVMIGENMITHEKLFFEMPDTCELHPVTDDMALAPKFLQRDNRRLVVEDAEEGWFLRVDHLDKYGVEPSLEQMTIDPPKPLIFLNIQAVPGSTCLIWEHIMDDDTHPCPNPRVIAPRECIENIIDEPVEVDVRSFGVRTPPCTREKPNYGIIGFLHILPPALAWIWRLVAPRGHSNPSIITPEGLVSEGVGSFWPFATGLRVRHANILLEMIRKTARTRYVLIPNQHVGAYRVSFKPEWITREYMARRGSVIYREGQLLPARCPLLGYTPPNIRVSGQAVPAGLLRVDEQLEVGPEGYDQGAQILREYFEKELRSIYSSELHPKGRAIIQLCLDGAGVDDYAGMLV